MPTRRDALIPLRDRLRAAGLRATASRATVLGCLLEASTPMSHAEVHDSIGGEGFDRATVYRNLMDLADAGLARRSDLGDHVWRFEAVREDSGQAELIHPHFVCTECGTVECLPPGTIRLDTARSAPPALRRKDLEVHLRGLCDACV